MRHLRHFGCRYALMLFFAAALLSPYAGLVATAQRPQRRIPPPPPTRAVEVADALHGITIADPYRWLEEQNSPATRAWIEAQNRYTNQLLGAVEGRDRIRARIEQLLKIDIIGVPVARGDRYFFTRRRANENQAVIYVRRNGRDEILVNPNESGAATNSVNIMAVSRDGKYLAYGFRQGGADEVSVRLLDVDTRREIADHLPTARYFGLSFKPDNSGFYYTRYDSTNGPRVYYHELGTERARDREIFGAGYGPAQIIGTSISSDGRYLTIFVSHGSAASKVEVYVQNLAENGPITPIVNDLDATFSGAVGGDQLFLLTNWQAENRRIIAIDLRNPARERWRTVVPEAANVMSGFTLAGGKLFVSFLENVTTRIKVYEPTGRHVRDIQFPTLGSGGVAGQWDRDEAFYTFSSFAAPLTIYRYQVSNGRQEEWARINIPVRTDQIEVRQVWYESKDRTRIPMFVAHRRGLRPNGNSPVLLTGYGGFRSSQTPGFSARAAFWVENGGVFAVPALRGGGEFGEAWHRAGMLERKQNTFDDFIAAAEWLIRNRYTRPSRLAISGGSNGGLLVGAAMTQRPDLFQAVVCSYPLLDMVRYHRFLVARFWVPEYGSAEDPAQFRYIRAYSPYHNVRRGARYPAVLFITGDSDTRVDPLHARKMTALMQASTGSTDRPVLLTYDTRAGHSGGLPVSQQIENLTNEMSFLFWQLGMRP